MAINPKSINQTLGLNTFFGGNAMPLAEMFTGDTEAAKEMNKEEALICQDCFLLKSGELVSVAFKEGTEDEQGDNEQGA